MAFVRSVRSIGVALGAEVHFPMYRIVDKEFGNTVVVAEDVDGFFAEMGEGVTDVTFLRVHQFDGSRGKLEEAVLEVMNSTHMKIGEYHVGRVRLGRTVSGEMENDLLPNVPCCFPVGGCEFPEARDVWRRWASAADIEPGEWFQWPSRYREAWLHVVQNSWFATGRRAVRYETGSVVFLDGEKIASKAGFYCALGEAANGPGGYFGSNLDALVDCLSSTLRENPPFQIVWNDFEVSRDLIGEEFIGAVLAVMRDFQIDVHVR
jgi:RNAse (barnase) inhibitor barstar